MKFPLATAAMILALPLFAQPVPPAINYQGRLTDNTPSQTPINATVQMQFAIYDVGSGGTPLWQEPAANNTGVGVTVTGGIFSYLLGNTVAIPASVFSGVTSIRFLQITLNPAGSAEILAPRQTITATGYANFAANADSANSAATATTAINSTQLGGVSAGGYLLKLGTAVDSDNLGGSPAAGYQKRTAAGAFTCSGLQVLQAAAADGAPTCVTPSASETDPKVGTLTAGRVPYWNTTSLADGTMLDTGGKVGIDTYSPIAPFHVGAASPVNVGSSNTGLSYPYSVHVQGRYAYVMSYGNNSLVIFDISNPANPVNVSSSTAGLSVPQSVYVQGRYAYVASSGNNSLVIFDISNPANPVNVGSSSTGLNYPSSVQVQGRYAFVTSYNNSSLVVFDITNPANPVYAGSSTTGLNGPRFVQVQGRYAFVASYNNSSLVIFDISNPASPVNVGASAVGLNNPRSVYVQGRYAFVASESNSALVVFEISGSANPAYVSSSSLGLSYPYSVVVHGRYAFVASSGNSSLVTIDISTPSIPVYTGASSTGLNYPYSVSVQGRYAFVASGNNAALVSFDLGGAYLQQLEAGGIETGTLATRSSAQIGGDADVKGGLSVGSGGIYTPGPVGLGGPLRLSSGTPGTGKVLASDADGNASWTTLDAGTITAGTLAVSRGGSGAASLTGVLLGNGTSPFTASTTSAGIAGAISDETGSGALVFGTSPALTTPAITGGTANNLVIGGATPAAATVSTLKIGATGTGISKSTRYTVSVPASSIAASSCISFAITVSGETAGAECAAGAPASPGIAFTWNCFVSSATAATLRLCNVSTAPVTPAAGTWNVRVFTP